MLSSKKKKLAQSLKISAIVVACVISVSLLWISFASFFDNLKQGGIDGENATCIAELYAGYDVESGLCKSNEDKAYDEIIFVVGNTANSQAPSLSQDVKNILKNSMMGHLNNVKDSIKIFSATSRTSEISLDLPNIKDTRMKKVAEAINNSIAEIDAQIKSAPKSDGAQYLEAINYASGYFTKDNTSSKTKKLLVVIGSGLSDGGVLNFANEDQRLLRKGEEKTKAFVDNLVDSRNLKVNSLNDVNVMWTNLGEVAMPQTPLTQKEKNNIELLYKNILTCMGAKDFKTDAAYNENSIIDTDGYKVKVTQTGMITITETELGFVPGTSIFKNENDAATALMKVVDYIDGDSSALMTVTGYMASGNCSNNASTELSGMRAEVVKNALINQLGVNNRIKVVNGGVKEGSECINGVWSNELAQAKRIVTIEVE